MSGHADTIRSLVARQRDGSFYPNKADLAALDALLAENQRLRDALRFWIDRAQRFEDALPAEKRYMAARGILNRNYTEREALAGDPE